MTSDHAQIAVSYDVSNDFFRLWLDESMFYTCAVFEREDESLEQAQINKARILYDYAEISRDKHVLDIGCGWGANLEYLVSRGVQQAHGITLSRAQSEEIQRRNLPGVQLFCTDYKDFRPARPYHALQSFEMIDHLCSPAQSARGLAIELYRQYFARCAQFVEPGACFGFQAILRNRMPRRRSDMEDMRFTADVIFPGGLNPRLEELVAAVNPYWEIEELVTQRRDYERTTAEWLRRLRREEAAIRARFGDARFDEYERYLSICVRAFQNHWSSDVRMKLRRID